MTDVVQIAASPERREPSPWISIILAPLLTILGGTATLVVYTSKMDATLATHTTHLETVDGRLDKVETRLGAHDADLAQVTAKIEGLVSLITEDDRKNDVRFQNQLSAIQHVQDVITEQLIASSGGRPFVVPPRR